jgi:hypothetical protein
MATVLGIDVLEVNERVRGVMKVELQIVQKSVF